ncbi:hypothetical protein BD779DRAFT_1472386 [Infundibulicybe gibba]|nr:hypothetical protein BD779DRAFT_1472386 [Infundibulicybe gibba]
MYPNDQEIHEQGLVWVRMCAERCRVQAAASLYACAHGAPSCCVQMRNPIAYVRAVLLCDPWGRRLAGYKCTVSSLGGALRFVRVFDPVARGHAILLRVRPGIDRGWGVLATAAVSRPLGSNRDGLKLTMRGWNSQHLRRCLYLIASALYAGPLRLVVKSGWVLQTVPLMILKWVGTWTGVLRPWGQKRLASERLWNHNCTSMRPRLPMSSWLLVFASTFGRERAGGGGTHVCFDGRVRRKRSIGV